MPANIYYIRICPALIFILFAFTQVSALDPQKPLHQFTHNVWTSNDGLPQNSVYAMVQTRDRYLWLGTQEGLVRYDGARFEIFDKSNTPAIRHNWITSLHEDLDGKLWIGTNGGGAAVYHSGQWKTYTTQDGLVSDFVWSVMQSRDSAVWIGTNHGLSSFKNGLFANYTKKDGLSGDMIRSVIEDYEGGIWVGTHGDGVCRLINNRWEFHTTKNGLSNNAVLVCYTDRENNIWVGTFGGGLNRFRNGQWRTYSVKDGLPNDMISGLYQDESGSLWIGTRGGLSRFTNGVFSNYSVKQGLSNNHIKTFLEDHEGSLWIGSDGGGLNRFRDSKIITYSSRQGLSYNIVRCVYEDRAGAMWIGTSGGGVNRFKNGQFTALTAEQGLSSDIVWSVYEDKQGRMWIGTDGNGVNVYDGKTINVYRTRNGMSNDFIRSICGDEDGRVWIGTLNGLNCYQNGRFTVYSAENGLTSNMIYSVAADHEGTVWAGTNGGGVNYFKNGEWRAYTTKDGLSNDVVTCTYVDRDRVLWAGTDGGGLNRYADGKWTHYHTGNGLYDNLIFSIVEDDKGHLWMSCNRGVFEVSRKELNDYADGKIQAVHSIAYTGADGMLSPECCGRNQPTGWKTRDGKIWFPTVIGAVMVNPENTKSGRTPPPVHISNISADDTMIGTDVLSAGAMIVLRPGTEKLEFHYSAVSFIATEKVLFRYRLEGFDKNWVEAGTRRTAYYTNVPPGQYTFRVKACNHDGLWNESGAAVTVQLQPFIYQTWWFAVFCLILMILAGFLMFRIRIMRIERRKEELEKQVQEKTAMIGEQKTELENTLAELKHTQARLVQSAKMTSLGHLVAGLAHEINNPITFIYSNLPYLENHIRQMNKLIASAEMLLDRDNRRCFDDLKQQADYDYVRSDLITLMQSMNKGAERIREIILNLRTFSRLDESEWQLSRIHENLDAAVSLLSKQHEHRIRFIRDYGDLPEIECAGGRLNQVFMHILKNAVQAIPDQGDITIRTRMLDGRAEIRILDNGAGMDAETRQKIFDPFFTTQEVGRGFGLGLSISYGIIQEHNGTIEVVSELGRGSEFIITLPLKHGL